MKYAYALWEGLCTVLCHRFLQCRFAGKIGSIRAASEDAKIYLAKVGRREELTYHVRNDSTGLFLFVVEGAFEVQNVLLEGRDGLALEDTKELELEASPMMQLSC